MWKEGSGLMELGDLPSPLLSKSRPREHLCQQGTNKLHVKQQKVHFPGGSWAGKNQTLCVQLNIFSNFIL